MGITLKLRFKNPLDDAETFVHKNNELIGIGNRANDISEIQAQYMGLIKLSKKGWNAIMIFTNHFRMKSKIKWI